MLKRFKVGRATYVVEVLGPDPYLAGWVYVRFTTGAQHEARVRSDWLKPY